MINCFTISHDCILQAKLSCSLIQSCLQSLLEVASFPGSPHTSTAFLHCKRQKAGRGLGMRLSLRYMAILCEVGSWDIRSPSQLCTWFWRTQTSAGSQRHGTGPQASECMPHLQGSQSKTPVFGMFMPSPMKWQHSYSGCIISYVMWYSNSVILGILSTQSFSMTLRVLHRHNQRTSQFTFGNDEIKQQF